MREACQLDKANIVPTPLFYTHSFLLGIGGRKTNSKMKKHLHNSLRALFLSLAVLLSLPMMAVEVEIDGINYDLVAETKQATVIAKSSGKYSGEVVIPESVEHEGTAHSVTSIGEDAFYYCEGLTSVHISDIAAWCNIDFDGAYSHPLYHSHHLYLNGEEVKDLIIPNSVTSIGEKAFYYCSGLTSVTIGNSVTSIGESAFSHCSGLTSVTIGNSVTSIGKYAFSSCSDLTSVTIPNSVTSIGDQGFYGCSGLTSVTIGNSVTSIREATFFGCSGLTSVTIPNSVTYIGHQAFFDCSGLTSVTIGSSVESIGSWAFRNCSKLLDVYCYAENVPYIWSEPFYLSPIADATLHVPNASVDSYKATAPWSSFGNIVALPEYATGIDELKGENGKVKTEIFDLSGRRVQMAQKGIFIQNGKVVVK